MSTVRSDYLVIGSGLAGLFAAIEAAKHGRVALVTKRQVEECNTVWAQGGISCVMAEINGGDSFETHVLDTLEAGAGLCNEEVVRAIVAAAPARIRDLIDLGVNFTTRGEVDHACPEEIKDQYDLTREGGHSERRILHAGDITGAELIRALAAYARRHPNIVIFENLHAVDLITTRRLGWDDPQDQCLGAYILDNESGRVRTFLASHTLLACGGAGKVYQFTTNPDTATGDGIAMACRAGADIANMEFFQFHPTCLFHHEVKNFLISEAIRGEGAVLKVIKKGRLVEFMDKYHALGSLAPRDIVARAIDRELKESGQKCVYLDIRQRDTEYLQRRFPKIFETLKNLGIDMAKDLIPVVPAAHYCCGGVKTGIDGAVDLISRLYAIGETACTGLHGANRLASNSLLEAVVMAHEAIAHSLTAPVSDSLRQRQENAVPQWTSGKAVDSDEQVVITHNWQEIRSFMWDYVGIFRTTKRLQRAKRRIRSIQNEIELYYWNFLITPDLIELRSLACIGELIIDSALSRRESLGLHYNLDFPECSASPQPSILKRIKD